jgi:DNA-binding LacI/PurR family transcriptional regulator
MNFEEKLQAQPRSTAIICGNDILAIGAVKRLKSLALCVPQDISIAGFDDIEVSSIIEPELTIAHIPHRNIGKIAAEQLLEMRRNQTMAPGIELKPFIVECQSLAKPLNRLGLFHYFNNTTWQASPAIAAGAFIARMSRASALFRFANIDES